MTSDELRKMADDHEYQTSEVVTESLREAADDIDRLTKRVAELEFENERLLSLCRKQQDEIETLNGFADAVEALRDIGKVTGCNHVDCPDGRRQLVNCVEQTIDALLSENERLKERVAELEADAKRYRWLRGGTIRRCNIDLTDLPALGGRALDRFIDEKIAKEANT